MLNFASDTMERERERERENDDGSLPFTGKQKYRQDTDIYESGWEYDVEEVELGSSLPDNPQTQLYQRHVVTKHKHTSVLS